MATPHAPTGVTHAGTPSRGAIADAVGHCILVFAFAPALLSIPAWLGFEFSNLANLREPVILAFVPVRGFLKLLDGFYAGAVPGILAGCLQGLFLSAWCWRRGEAQTRPQNVAVGASGGLLAAGLVLLLTQVGPQAIQDAGAARALPIPLELGSGMLCGILAAPAAVRLLMRQRPGVNESASQ